MQFMLLFLSAKYNFSSVQNISVTERRGTCIHKLFMGISAMAIYQSWLHVGLR